MRQWLTPDSPVNPSLKTGRIFCLHPDYLPYITGAIAMLTDSYNWEQGGTMTPDDMAQVFEKVLLRECDYMIGEIKMFPSFTMPDGVLLCDGTVYNKSDYPILYAMLPSVYRVGFSQFKTPDLRSRFVYGASVGGKAIGSVGGGETHTLTESEIPSHTHTHIPPVLNVDLESPAGAPDISAAGVGAQTVTGATGGGQPHNNMPPYHSLVYGIVAI